MLEYARIEPLMEITAAGDNVLSGTAQGILLVVVRATDDVLRTVKFPIVVVPGIKRSSFSSLSAAQKDVKTIIGNSSSSLDLGVFSVQLTRLDNMDYLDLTIEKESRKTESALCAASGKTFGKESERTAFVLKNPVVLSMSSLNVNQRAIENPCVKDKNKILTYKIHGEVSFCVQIESNITPPLIGDTNKGNISSNFSSCKQTKSDAPLFTSPMAYSPERRISSRVQII